MSEPQPPSDQTSQKPPLFYNKITIPGVALVAVGLVSGLFLFLLGYIVEEPPSYIGLLIVPPALLFAMGAALIPLGWWLTYRQVKRGKTSLLGTTVRLDFARVRHRRLALALLVMGAIGVVFLLGGAVETYHGLETNEFCGQTCHSVMSPEATAYTYGPHARVKCVSCHVGGDMQGFVAAKTSGIRRIMGVLFGSYARPIPTPVHDMRPARETCEQCHFRTRFVAYKEKALPHFLGDEKNTPAHLRTLVKIGGVSSTFVKGLKGAGIHYHMLFAHKVEYIAKDQQRQQIAWVKVTDPDGKTREYANTKWPLSLEEKQTLPVRSMDCLDCHNRPAHQFPAPIDLVNDALDAGTLPRDLPYLKREAVKALDGDWPDGAAADVGIAKSLGDFYAQDYPELARDRAPVLEAVVREVQRIYHRAFFPEMNVKWSAYPNNIGHRDWPGCFRCHSDDMVQADGTAVFTACNVCHLVLAQGEGMNGSTTVDYEAGEAFVHPGDDGVYEDFILCSDCHSGGKDLY